MLPTAWRGSPYRRRWSSRPSACSSTDSAGARSCSLNGLDLADWTEPGWHYWFIEALVYILLLMALLLAVPGVDRLERRWPFGFPFALAVAGLLTRYGVVGLGGTDEIHRAHVDLLAVRLGWAAAKATSRRHRVLLTLLVVASVPGFFQGFERNAYVVVGMLILVWLPLVRVPHVVARVAGVLAGAACASISSTGRCTPIWSTGSPGWPPCSPSPPAYSPGNCGRRLPACLAPCALIGNEVRGLRWLLTPEDYVRRKVPRCPEWR